ncbi:hypothetical protein DAEQUDRAFT_741633 [Daedalea quercina L-15889]|uniref:DUF6533 domain-containing protein n=1 Tax=Daedalea quercina L-15889 TaxID=1314783 RepID=A0A165L3P9_9APHY|nr:hypothetical protein DAEQUDRAFT_741633 [Daedalea quercina L-15889]
MASANTTQEIASILEDGYVSGFCCVSAFVIIVYDHCLLLEEEIKFIWRRKLSITTLLYGALRAMSLLYYFTSTIPGSTCEIDYLLSIVSLAALAVLVLDCAVIDALRIYALNGRRWGLSLLVIALLATDIAYLISIPCRLLHVLGTRSTHGTAVNYTSLAALIIGNGVVLCVTWRQTYHIKKLADAADIRTSMSALLLKDGSIYFGSVLLLNAASSALTHTASTSGFSGMPAFITTFTTVLFTRFLLNLREAALVPELPSDASGVSNTLLQPTYGGVGGSIVYCEESGEDDGYEYGVEDNVRSAEGHVQDSEDLGYAELNTGIEEVRRSVW